MKPVIIASAVGGVVLVAGAVALLPKDEGPALPPVTPSPAPAPAIQAPVEESFFVETVAQPQGPGGPWGEMITQYTREFDANSDGQLDADEMRRALAAWEQRMLAQYDANGDGVLSPEERRAAMEGMIRERNEQEMLRRYDRDGDGVLNEAEQAQREADRAEREARRQQWELQQFDLNRDGVVTDAERQEVQQKREAERQAFTQALTARFDADGNGQMDRGEWRNAMQQMREDGRDLMMARRVDADGNGVADGADLAAWAQKIAAGDMSADLNRDGVLDQSDLQWASEAVQVASTRQSDPAWDAMLMNMGRNMMGGRGGPGGPGGPAMIQMGGREMMMAPMGGFQPGQGAQMFMMPMGGDQGRGGGGMAMPGGMTGMTPEAGQVLREWMTSGFVGGDGQRGGRGGQGGGQSGGQGGQTSGGNQTRSAPSTPR